MNDAALAAAQSCMMSSASQDMPEQKVVHRSDEDEECVVSFGATSRLTSSEVIIR